MSDIDCAVIQMIRERLDRIDGRLSRLENQHDEILKFYYEHNATASIKTFIVKNWWKLAAVIIPVLFILGEISLHIRRLV